MDRSSELQVDPFGLQRVEVIQGPSSVLHGQIPPGGLVNLVSKTPPKGTDFTNVGVGGGSFSTWRKPAWDPNGTLNASGSIHGRINLPWRQYGNFTDAVDPSQHRLFAPFLTVELGKHTTLTLLGQYYHDWRSIAFPLPAAGTVLPNPSGRVTRFRNVGEPDTYPNGADNCRVLLGYQFEHRFNDVFTPRQNARAAFNETVSRDPNPSVLKADDRTLERFARVTKDDTLPNVGNRPLDVPEHTFNLFTKYTIQNGALRGLDFGVDHHHQTDQAGDSANTFRLPSDGFLKQVNVNNERHATVRTAPTTCRRVTPSTCATRRLAVLRKCGDQKARS